MTGKKMRLKLVSPTKQIYEGFVNMAIIRTTEGDLGVLPGHEHLTTLLGYGALRVFRDGEEDVYVVLGGYCKIMPDVMTILADAAEHVEEIDVDRARLAKERAEKMLEEQEQDANKNALAELALRRALVRLEMSSYPMIKGNR